MEYSHAGNGKQPNGVKLLPELPVLSIIPPVLQTFYGPSDRWVCWDYKSAEDGTFFPVAISAPSTLSKTYERAESDGFGLAFLLPSKSLISVVHLPNCFTHDGRMLKLDSAGVMRLLPTYSEVDHTGNGITVILQARGEENVKSESVEVWTQDYMLLMTGNRYGRETDARNLQDELQAVIGAYCMTTWMQRVERLKGTGTEEGVLTEVLGECLETITEFVDDGDRTQLYPFLAKCWKYHKLRYKIRACAKKPPFYNDKKLLGDLEKIVESHIPKKEKRPKSALAGEEDEYEDGPDYIRTPRGDIKEVQANYEKMLSETPEWAGRLRFNALTCRVELDEQGITDIDRHRISSWASHKFNISGGAKIIRDQAINVVAYETVYDPIRDYLNALPEWDGVERLSSFFFTYFGVEVNVYTQWCGPMLFAHMIARGLNPGCPGRYVTVLEGPQYIGKSLAVRALGDPWVTELGTSMDSRDSHIQLKGSWVVELGELNSMRKSNSEAINSFISATHDEYVPKYSNDPISFERRCTFIGTTNRADYLKDPTGSTRWFPLKVRKADFKAIERDRDILFAEAMAWYQTHQSDWWIIPSDVEEILETEREKRREVNPYEETIATWIKNTAKQEVTWPMIADECLGIPVAQMKDKTIQMTVTDALKALGWERGAQKRVDGVRVFPWYRAEEASSPVPTIRGDDGVMTGGDDSVPF